MGVNQSNSSFSSDLIFQESFYSTDFGGEVRVLKHSPTQTKVIARVFNSLHINLQRRLGFDSPNLMKVYGSDPDPRDGPAGRNPSAITHVVYLEYLPLRLSDILIRRFNTMAYFPEDELIELLDGVVSALAYLQEQKVWHSCLSPDTIFFDEAAGIYKIYDNEVVQGTRNAGPMLFATGKRFYYLSPEVLQAVGRGDYQNLQGVDPYQADCFSLGMIVLESASLRSSSELYDYQRFSINFKSS